MQTQKTVDPLIPLDPLAPAAPAAPLEPLETVKTAPTADFDWLELIQSVDMEIGWNLLLFFALGMVGLFIASMGLRQWNISHRRTNLEAEIRGYTEYSFSTSYIGEDGLTAIGISRSDGILVLFTAVGGMDTAVIHYRDIISAEVIALEDKRAKYVGGIELHLVVRQTMLYDDAEEAAKAGGQATTVQSDFFVAFTSEPTKIGGFTYNMAVNKANQWFALVKELIARGEAHPSALAGDRRPAGVAGGSA